MSYFDYIAKKKFQTLAKPSIKMLQQIQQLNIYNFLVKRTNLPTLVKFEANSLANTTNMS